MELIKYQINNITVSKFTRHFTKYIQDINYSIGSDCQGNCLIIVSETDKSIIDEIIRLIKKDKSSKL